MVISSIQPESRKVNFPASGIFSKYRVKNGLRRSSSVGAAMEKTLKNRGSMFLIILPMVLPFPAAPQPSISTSTGSFLSLSCICCTASFSWAAFSRTFTSSLSGRAGRIQFLSILLTSVIILGFHGDIITYLSEKIQVLYKKESQA